MSPPSQDGGVVFPHNLVNRATVFNVSRFELLTMESWLHVEMFVTFIEPYWKNARADI
jgi:hypothetical protein